jgi:hypothetical protein
MAYPILYYKSALPSVLLTFVSIFKKAEYKQYVSMLRSFKKMSIRQADELIAFNSTPFDAGRKDARELHGLNFEKKVTLNKFLTGAEYEFRKEKFPNEPRPERAYFDLQTRLYYHGFSSPTGITAYLVGLCAGYKDELAEEKRIGKMLDKLANTQITGWS